MHGRRVGLDDRISSSDDSDGFALLARDGGSDALDVGAVREDDGVAPHGILERVFEAGYSASRGVVVGVGGEEVGESGQRPVVRHDVERERLGLIIQEEDECRRGKQQPQPRPHWGEIRCCRRHGCSCADDSCAESLNGVCCVEPEEPGVSNEEGRVLLHAIYSYLVRVARGSSGTVT